MRVWLTPGTSQAEFEAAAKRFPTDDAVLFLAELQDNGYSLEAEPEPFEIQFPPPRDIDVNMMPFLLDGNFEKSRLPDYLRPYWPIVERCLPRDQRTTGSSGAGICFLTVQESFVEGGRTQRRPGLHVDCPGGIRVKGAGGGGGGGSASGNWQGAGESRRYAGTEWGLGACHLVPAQPHAGGRDRHARLRGFQLEGGIYMASSVENSCRAWNCKIVPEEEEEEPEEETVLDDDENIGAIGGSGKAGKINKSGKDKTDKSKSGKSKSGKTKKGKSDKKVRRREAIGTLGNIEHLRHLLPPELAQTMKPNHLYWMTDRTPHESLPMREGTYRQFFRLVTSRVSLWYEDHSTPNPNGVRPNPKITKIVRGNKFDPEGVVIVA